MFRGNTNHDYLVWVRLTFKGVDVFVSIPSCLFSSAKLRLSSRLSVGDDGK